MSKNDEIYLMFCHSICDEFEKISPEEEKTQKKVVEFPVGIFNVLKIKPALPPIYCHFNVTCHEPKCLK